MDHGNDGVGDGGGHSGHRGGGAYGATVRIGGFRTTNGSRRPARGRDGRVGDSDGWTEDKDPETERRHGAFESSGDGMVRGEFRLSAGDVGTIYGWGGRGLSSG